MTRSQVIAELRARGYDPDVFAVRGPQRTPADQEAVIERFCDECEFEVRLEGNVPACRRLTGLAGICRPAFVAMLTSGGCPINRFGPPSTPV